VSAGLCLRPSWSRRTVQTRHLFIEFLGPLSQHVQQMPDATYDPPKHTPDVRRLVKEPNQRCGPSRSGGSKRQPALRYRLNMAHRLRSPHNFFFPQPGARNVASAGAETQSNAIDQAPEILSRSRSKRAN
jgi:hypothetical protein